MKIKKLLLVLLAVLLVFSLFGCGKKEPVEDVEPQDTAEQLDENIKNDISGTYELSNEEIAKYYEYGYLDAKGTIMQSIQSLKSKAKACAEKLGLTYSDAQAFNLFAYGSAIEQTKKTIRSATDFIYPSDGLQQFISWREQYEAGKTDADFDKELDELLKGIEDGTYGDTNSTGNTGTTGNTGNTGSTGTGNTGEVSNEPDTSDPGAYEGGQPDDTVYDPDAGEDKTDPRLQDNSGIKVGTAYGTDTSMSDENDFSGLGYGISG